MPGMPVAVCGPQVAPSSSLHQEYNLRTVAIVAEYGSAVILANNPLPGAPPSELHLALVGHAAVSSTNHDRQRS